jgi:polyisoprenoid-binding protein YceI
MTDTATPTARVLHGRSVPAAGVWAVDASHSTVGFVARHMMVAKTRGSFGRYDVALVIGENPADSTLNVKIDANSLDTNDEGRDGHVKSADFLDVETYPELTFASTAVQPGKGDEHWDVTGDLTIHGVTRSVTIDVEFNGVAVDPWNHERAIFEAELEIDREDFGLGWNQPLAGGGVLIGKKVKIELNVETVRQTLDA